MGDREKLVVEFEPGVLADIFAATHLCAVEISGLARVQRDGRKFRVFDNAILLNQTCSMTRTEPDIEEINLWFNSIIATGDEQKIKEMESQTLWWHSHVKFQVVFSGQDHQTMYNLLSGFDEWWLVLVVNKYNQRRLALIEKNDGFMLYEETRVRLNPEMTSKEFEALVASRMDYMQRLIDERVTIIRDRIG